MGLKNPRGRVLKNKKGTKANNSKQTKQQTGTGNKKIMAHLRGSGLVPL